MPDIFTAGEMCRTDGIKIIMAVFPIEGAGI